jgi:poly(hydroxyalkanoate) depolymerase family esterase
MSIDLASAMRRALEHTRAQNLNEATAVIQAALAGHCSSREGPSLAGVSSPPASHAPFSVLDRGVDTVEPAPLPCRSQSARGNAIPFASNPLSRARHRPPSLIGPKALSAREAIFARGKTDSDQKAADHAADPNAAPSHRRIRRSLGDVVSALRDGRSSSLAAVLPAIGAPSAPVSLQIPDGAQFLARSYACRAGSRQYRLYIPAERPDGPQGLVVMLHGCTQSPDDFAVGTGMNAVAEEHGLLVAYPAQTSMHNGGSCWNWFRPGDQRRDIGEPAIIAGITRALIAEFDIDPSRVYVAGLSAGGAMAAVMGEVYPELCAAIGVHSGLPYGSASDVVSAFAAMRDEPGGGHPMPRLAAGGKAVRTIVFHGSADQTVHPANAGRIIAAARARTEASEVRRVEGRSFSGRTYTRTIALTADGAAIAELWMIEGAGHAWSGGQAAGSYTDPAGPDASAEMVRFFLNDSSRERSQ